MLQPRFLLSLCFLALLAAPSAASDAWRDAKNPPKIGRTGTLDVADIARLKARIPSEPLDAVSFRTDAGKGWVVRMPHPRKVATTGNSRLATVPSPAVRDGKVYAGVGFDGWSVHAFHAKSGRHSWSSKLNDNGPSAPVITPRAVVCNSESCTTYVITPSTGKVVWSKVIGPSVMAAPAVDEKTIYTAFRNKRNEYVLAALALDDGETIWERSLTRDVYGAPILSNGRLYVGCRDGVVACFEKDGTPIWWTQSRARSAPWVTPDGVYVSEGSAWRAGPPAVRCLDVATGRALWRTDTAAKIVDRRVVIPQLERGSSILRLMSQWSADGPRPVVVGQRCYLAGGRDLISYDAATGAVKYLLKLPEGRRFHAPPAVLGKRLLYATLEGMLLEVDGPTGKIVEGLDLQRMISSQPVVAEGRVHVVSEDLLFTLPWGDKDMPSWPQWGGRRDETRVVTGRRR